MGLAATCGPTGDSSCCASLEVPGGTFYEGYDASGDGMFPSMAYLATVSSFHLDAYEVTVARFRAFLAAGQGTQASPVAVGAGAHAAIANSGWQAAWNAGLAADTPSLIAGIKACNGDGSSSSFTTWTDTPGANENRPIDCMSWYEAFAFCIWDGGYLPTVAEEMYAAAGGNDQRAYPWSSSTNELAISASDATYYDGTECVGGTDPSCGVDAIVPVGSKPDGNGKWGHADLAGNIAEDVLDWYINGTPTFLSPCDNCAQVVDPGSHAHATYEGAFDTSIPSQRSAALMFSVSATARWGNCGFRCARP